MWAILDRRWSATALAEQHDVQHHPRRPHIRLLAIVVLPVGYDLRRCKAQDIDFMSSMKTTCFPNLPNNSILIGYRFIGKKQLAHQMFKAFCRRRLLPREAFCQLRGLRRSSSDETAMHGKKRAGSSAQNNANRQNENLCIQASRPWTWAGCPVRAWSNRSHLIDCTAYGLVGPAKQAFRTDCKMTSIFARSYLDYGKWQ